MLFIHPNSFDIFDQQVFIQNNTLILSLVLWEQSFSLDIRNVLQGFGFILTLKQ